MSKARITVRVDLQQTHWKPAAGGKGSWHCAALRLPGARFVGLVGADDRHVDENWYERRGRSILWKGGSNPPSLQAELHFGSVFAARARSLMMLLMAFLVGAGLAREVGMHDVISLATQALAMIGGGSFTG
jgi:hypothetical protein